MSNDILSEYGRDSSISEKPRATEGGCCHPKDLAYDPPKGPKGQMRQGPGLGGENYGTCGTQGKR